MRKHLKDYIDKSRTPNVRGLRILLEYFYATEIFEPIVRDNIKIISVFGSARAKEGTREYREAYRLGRMLYRQNYAVVTGASCGIMQAANQGVADEIAEKLMRLRKAKTMQDARQQKAYAELLHKYSVGLKISLPFEPVNNPYVGVNATFHYFMVRKFFFGSLSSGFIACEGGWGTRDELYEMLTLVQTGKAPLMPIIYVSPDPDHLERDLAHTVRKKYIHKEDLKLLQIVKRAEDAVAIVERFYKRVERIEYLKENQIRIYFKTELAEPQKKSVLRACLAAGANIGSYKLAAKHIDFVDYPHISYGYLRHIVDVINA